MTFVANAPLIFPDPRQLQCNTPQPSASRHLAVRLPAYRVRKRPEAIATAASKVCRPFPVPRLSRGQHLLAVAAVDFTAVAVAAASGINFLLL
jgi:hypothetical protein